MNELQIHPLAETYLKEFDALSGVLQKSRRDTLRADIKDHLVDSIRPEMTDSEVKRVICALGSPAEIIEESGSDSRAHVAASLSRKFRVLVALAISAGIVCVLAGLVGLVVLFYRPLGGVSYIVLFSTSAVFLLFCAGTAVAAIREHRDFRQRER